MDGCTGIRKAFAVTFPAIKQQLVLCIFNTIIGYFGLYGQIYVLTGGGPISDYHEQSTMSIMWFLQRLVNDEPGNRYYMHDGFGMASAMGLILGVIIGIITAIQLIITRERKSGNKRQRNTPRISKRRRKSMSNLVMAALIILGVVLFGMIVLDVVVLSMKRRRLLSSNRLGRYFQQNLFKFNAFCFFC